MHNAIRMTVLAAVLALAPAAQAHDTADVMQCAVDTSLQAWGENYCRYGLRGLWIDSDLFVVYDRWTDDVWYFWTGSFM